MLIFIASGFALFLILAHFHSPALRFFNSSGALAIWLFATVTIAVGVFGCYMWAKYVPQKIALALAITAWAILLFLLFGLGYWVDA